MRKSSLVDSMARHYIDDEGNTISEAVELGISIITFISEIHESVGVASQQEDRGLINIVCDFYISLVLENFTRESFDHNSGPVFSQIETIKSMSRDVGNQIEDVVRGSYAGILDNEFFMHATCNILMRVLIIEAVMRTCNCHVFSLSPELTDGSDRHENVLITYANMQSSYHSLAMIAFLCNTDMENYYKMNIEVELYANKVCSKMTDALGRAARGY